MTRQQRPFPKPRPRPFRAGRRLPPRQRTRLLLAGWASLTFGLVTYPVPLIPSTPFVILGLVALAPVQPWARAAIVRLRRRSRAFNQAHGLVVRRRDRDPAPP